MHNSEKPRFVNTEGEIDRLWKLQVQTSELVRTGRRSASGLATLLQNFMTSPVQEATEKFALLVDLGIITVPDDYVHQTRLATFGKQNRKKFYYYNDKITDQNFPNPTRVLKPGDKLRVRAFKQVVGGTVNSEERMAFLATQKAIHTGAQGASLVFDQKRDQLPKGKWYASFDEKDRLWADADGHHRVPRVDAGSDGGFVWGLGALRVSGTSTAPSSASATSSSPWKLGHSVSFSVLRPFEPIVLPFEPPLHCEGSIFL